MKVLKQIQDKYAGASAERAIFCLAEEVGEFIGAYRRWSGQARRTGGFDDMRMELADVVISAWSTGAVLGIDMEEAIMEKGGIVLGRDDQQFPSVDTENARGSDGPNWTEVDELTYTILSHYQYLVGLGKELRRIRKSKGLSLMEVDDKTFGMFKATAVGSYERAEREIPITKLMELCGFYGWDTAMVVKNAMGFAESVAKADGVGSGAGHAGSGE